MRRPSDGTSSDHWTLGGLCDQDPCRVGGLRLAEQTRDDSCLGQAGGSDPEHVNVVFRVDSYPGEADPEKKSLQLCRESSEPLVRQHIPPCVGYVYGIQLPQSGASTPRARRRKQGKSNYLYVRYADDFVVFCNGSKAEALAMKEELKGVLSHMGLTLSEEKTKVTHVTAGFDFLGYRIIRSMGTSGKMVPKVLIPHKAIKQCQYKCDGMLGPRTTNESFSAKFSRSIGSPGDGANTTGAPVVHMGFSRSRTKTHSGIWRTG